MTQQQTAPVPADSSDTIAMVIEIIFGFFGILGMGWLYAGNFAVAIGAFLGYAIVVFIETAVAGLTLGIALCIIIPLNLAMVIISGIRVRDYVRLSGASGSILYLVLGFVVGAVVICGGITLLTGGLAALGSGL